MRNSTKSRLGFITSFIGFGVIAVAAGANLNNLKNKETPEYSYLKRDITFYSEVTGAGIMLGGMIYGCKRRDKPE